MGEPLPVIDMLEMSGLSDPEDIDCIGTYQMYQSSIIYFYHLRPLSVLLYYSREDFSMDIRRIPLWEGRNATYMSNDIINVVIEDQGEVCLEISNTCITGARVNPLSLPYFRGIGSGVLSDPNGEWYQMKQGLYQAGGSYFTFPYSSEDHITSNNTYWTVRKYGTEENYGGVWRLSEMKSREEGNRYHLEKVDLVIPGHPVLYTAIRITNTGDETIYASPSHSVMLGSPFFESGCFIDTNARNFSAYHRAVREMATNRFLSGPVFDDLKKAPLVKGGTADASYVPPPTGTYDYLLGKFPDRVKTGWISIINPRLQQLFISFTPSDMLDSFPNVFLVENYLGRMDRYLPRLRFEDKPFRPDYIANIPLFE